MLIRVLTVFELEEMEEILPEVKGMVNIKNECYGQIFDAFIYSGNLYMVVEYFPNGSLADLVPNTYRRYGSDAYSRTHTRLLSYASLLSS